MAKNCAVMSILVPSLSPSMLSSKSLDSIPISVSKIPRLKVECKGGKGGSGGGKGGGGKGGSGKGSSGKSTSGKSTPMSKADASRIQSATAKANQGAVPKGSFASRAQSAAAKNEGQSQSYGDGGDDSSWDDD